VLNTEELVADSLSPCNQIMGLHILSRSFQLTFYKPSNHWTYIGRLYIGHKQINRIKTANFWCLMSLVLWLKTSCVCYVNVFAWHWHSDMEFLFLNVVYMSVIVVFDRAFHHVVPKSRNRFRSIMELEVYTKTFHRRLILVCVGPVGGAMYLHLLCSFMVWRDANWYVYFGPV